MTHPYSGRPSGRAAAVTGVLTLTALVTVALVLIANLAFGRGSGAAAPVGTASSSGGDDGGAATTPPPTPSTTEPGWVPPSASPPSASPPSASPPPSASAPAAERPPVRELQGSWTGTASLTSCPGGTAVCPPTLDMELTIDCPQGFAAACSVVPLPGVGAEPLRSTGPFDTYGAEGTMPDTITPGCEKAPDATPMWSLWFGVEDDRLTGRYTEESSSTGGCRNEATTWSFALTRG